MNNKRAISIIAIIMAALMLFGLVASVIPMRAYAISQEDIDALQDRRNELSARVDEAQDRVDALKEEENSVLQEVAALEEKANAATEALELVDEELRMYDEIIAEKALEVDAAQELEDEQRTRYHVRVRAMEESGGFNFLSLLLNSNNFSEFLSALEDMSLIMQSDRKLEQLYREARQETERVKGEYEQVREDVQKKKDELREEQERIQAQIDDAKETLDSLSDQIDVAIAQYQSEVNAENAAADELTQLILRYQEQKRQEAEEERRRLEEEERLRNEQNNTGGGEGGTEPNPAPEGGGGEDGGENGGDNTGSDPAEGGSGEDPAPTPTPAPPPAPTPTPEPQVPSFSPIWPVPCSTRVTSRFGYRIDPFTGNVTGHQGIDIDGYANDGQPIVAAAGGTVIVASYGNSGYGNYVTIDHGNGYATVYAHMSGIAVGWGQWVDAGTTVGWLGSTGRSTGTHCHYEVRMNGTPIDPEQFYSGLSHWNC